MRERLSLASKKRTRGFGFFLAGFGAIDHRASIQISKKNWQVERTFFRVDRALFSRTACQNALILNKWARKVRTWIVIRTIREKAQNKLNNPGTRCILPCGFKQKNNNNISEIYKKQFSICSLGELRFDSAQSPSWPKSDNNAIIDII